MLLVKCVQELTLNLSLGLDPGTRQACHRQGPEDVGLDLVWLDPVRKITQGFCVAVLENEAPIDTTTHFPVKLSELWPQC